MKTTILLLGILIVFSSPIKPVEAFLARDTTNLNQYNKYNYDCTDFAADLVRNAESHGFRAESIVILFTHELGHVIVAFYTDDGTIYVEPQTDTIYPLVEVGQPLCNIDWCVGNGEAVRKIIIGIP
jgi:hypothetical protein